MKSMICSFILFFGFGTWAQGPIVSSSTYFCKTDEFLSRTGKVKTKDLKKCSGLLDASESQVKNGEDCKARAIAKGEACLKIMRTADQVSVKMKFTEKFGQNANLNSFTCEVDKAGNTACP